MGGCRVSPSRVAMVNGEAIDTAYFEQRVIEVLSEDLGKPETSAILPVSLEIVNQLVDERLILGRGKDLGLEVTEEEINDVYQQILRDYQEKSLPEVLSNQGMDWSSWKENIRRQLLIEKVVASDVYSKIRINPEDVAAYYQENKQDFQQLEQVKLGHIKAETREEAEEIVKQVKRKKNFEEIARQVEPEGIWQQGYKTYEELLPEFPAALKRKRRGYITGVIETSFGFYILKVIDYKRARGRKLKEVAGDIEKTLTDQKRDKEFSGWIKDIRQRSDIKIYGEYIRNAVVPRIEAKLKKQKGIEREQGGR